MEGPFVKSEKVKEKIFSAYSTRARLSQCSTPFVLQSVNQGQAFDFSLKVSGKKPLTVTWFRNETTKLKSSKKSKVTYSSSTGEAKLVIMESDAEDSGEYKLVASNDVGEAVQTCRVTVVCKCKKQLYCDVISLFFTRLVYNK